MNAETNTATSLINTIKINDTDLPVIEFQGERVLPFRLIDQIHERPDGTSRVRFNDNKKRFIENEDYFPVSAYEFHTLIWRELGFEPKSNQGVLISETGYLLLVKSFTDDLAWEIQRQLIRAYFRTRHEEDDISAKEYRYIRSKVTNLVCRLVKALDALEAKTIWSEIRYLSKVIDLPLPDLDLLGVDPKQLALPLDG